MPRRKKIGFSQFDNKSTAFRRVNEEISSNVSFDSPPELSITEPPFNRVMSEETSSNNNQVCVHPQNDVSSIFFEPDDR